jgi:hypothetical protein
MTLNDCAECCHADCQYAKCHLGWWPKLSPFVIMLSVIMLKVIQDKTWAKCSTLELTVRVPCIFIAMNQNSLT